MEVSIAEQDRLAIDAALMDSVVSRPLQASLIDRFYLYGLKRAVDCLGAIILLILLSPIFLVSSIIILRDSPGDVIFRQTRLGRNCKPFTCYKFRSMVVDAEYILQQDELLRSAHAVAWKVVRDPRVTRFGRFMRRTSIDELPQLINVLKGDMSLIGPRPYMLSELQGQFENHAAEITSVRPGMTGLWQISGRALLSPPQRIQLDGEYARNCTLVGDIRIVRRTIAVVILGIGAL